MPRSHRHDPEGGWHHVMNRGVDRMNIYRDEADRRWFLRLLREAADVAGVSVVAFCLVGNHFHLLLRCPSGGLSTAMWKLCAEYARVFNRRHVRDGPLFRGRFTSKLVDSDDYLAHLLSYIHLNSLDIGVSPDAWPWSSYRAYAGLVRMPTWLDASDALQLAGGQATHRNLVRAAAVQADGPGTFAADPSGVYEAWSAIELRATVEEIQSRLARSCPALSPLQRRDVMLVVAVDHHAIRPVDLAPVLDAASVGALRAMIHRARRSCAEVRELGASVELVTGGRNGSVAA